MDSQYSTQSCAERLIVTARIAMAVASFLAIRLGPSEPAGYAQIAYASLTVYMIYALLLALLGWCSAKRLSRLRLITHALDLAVFFLLVYVTEGLTSPFVPYFVLSLLCVTLRWQWRGMAGTALAALAMLTGAGVYAAEVLHGPAFPLNRLLIDGVFLAVAATLLAYVGACGQPVHSDLFKLAAWPRAILGDARICVHLSRCL
jgi:hypothetical protein